VTGERWPRTGPTSRTPPDCASQYCPVVRDIPAAAAACFSVAPDALAVKNLARTSAGFGFRPPQTSIVSKGHLIMSDIALPG